MAERTLQDCRILIVKDEYMLAAELQAELDDAGTTVLGPVATTKDALELIASEPVIDGVVLDINLDGELVFPVADLLTEGRVPFVLTTGYTNLSFILRRLAESEKWRRTQVYSTLLSRPYSTVFGC